MNNNVQSGRIVPNHVAVVMDGNGRWANKKLLPRTAGHRAGVKATRKLVENCARHGIASLTIFAFSSENWGRPDSEVDSLMELFISTLSSEINKLHKQNVHVTFIGDRSRFSDRLQAEIREAEALTRDNNGLKLNIAANYGGRWDIVNAGRNLIKKLSSGELTVENITIETFGREIQLHGQDEPDLFIRTGGEKRISNFMLWQLAYTELYFVDTLWPDFDDEAFAEALSWYATRQRRFGKTAQQIEKNKQRAG